ncbi:LamG-like jellyroll fold domain-containing protein [Hoylesella oralis]|uniref:LamG-like jellyroll fold domain-containing protein n=1 Tax=Hoylesella oralis TaxID=28134 RepID=UPI0028EB89B1|nr:LamG-like jellyroll fold domain-containing protein [Hoylesella oralis]
MKKRTLPIVMLGCFSLLSIDVAAQELQESYIKWSNSSSYKLPAAISTWKNKKQITEDDNFFISRVKPKKRFRNEATQVRLNLKEGDDKRLIAWLPFNDPNKNALPDGVFDSEVFSMWQYVNVWGDWTAPLGRIPAALLDVAHKNGVSVSSVASIPNAYLNGDWYNYLRDLKNTNVQDAADYLYYYGQDGLGYNSEYWEYSNITKDVRDFHIKVTDIMRTRNSIYENIWYDGTDDNGHIRFDQGLGSHNEKNFGTAEHPCYSLFFNYNWTNSGLLERSVKKAKEMQRDPLYLYAGINMQGGEPKFQNWTHLKNYPISIGLWGAHQKNMFWESRNEKGSNPETQQRTYMLRTERWFTGGTRNPANTPEVINTLNYSADNYNFPGMSSFMTAKSTLSWNLQEEPFITYFNLGNGKFFNWKGERKNNRPWYNVGVQDYLPTWRWWFAHELLGRTNIPMGELDAEFIWNDAYVGGSCMRVYGTTSDEYLHLFKTSYELKQGDVITVRYKLVGGKAKANLVLTTNGNESQAVNEAHYALVTTEQNADETEWTERKFTVNADLAGKSLALIALHFTDTKDLNLYLGEISIVRGSAATPVKPSIKNAKLLAFGKLGVDGKIIFNMQNSKSEGEPCYNSDVNTSLFKLYAKQGDGEPILMGITTSWAGMYYSIPVDFTKNSFNLRLGVSAVSLDMKTESEIVWSDELTPPQYVYDDGIQIDKNVIKPNESFKLSYVDPRHTTGTWTIYDADHNKVYSGTGTVVDVTGLPKTGVYSLELNGEVHDGATTFTQTRTFAGYIQITPEAIGALPQINSLTANGQEQTINVNTGDMIQMAYTGRHANGQLSRGIETKEKGIAFKATDAGLTNNKSAWSLAFWVKYNSIVDGSNQFVDMRDQFTSWPQNNWGCFWSTYDGKGKTLQFTIRNANSGGDEHKQNWQVDFTPGVWTHVVIAMESNGTGVRERIYINGKQATPTNWELGSIKGTGLSTVYQNTTAWWPNAYMLLGIGRHGCAALNGVVDDVKFFDRTLTESEVEKVMTTSDLSDAPKASWNFETDATADNYFISNGQDTSVKLARVEIKAGENEGQGTLANTVPDYQAGCPFVSGTAYTVTTVPVWKAPKGALTETSGSDMQGQSKVSYTSAGDYAVTLTLTNSYGSDSRTFQVIKVTSATGIHQAENAEIRTYTVDRDIFVEFADAGKYGVQVYTAQGLQVANAAHDVVTGTKVHVHVAVAGVYLLRIVKDGKTVRTVKLICK